MINSFPLIVVAVELGAGSVEHGRVQESGPRHRGLGEALEEVHRERGAGEGEVSAGVEEQGRAAEAVHDASAETGPHDLRRSVSFAPVICLLQAVCCSFLHFLCIF